MVMSNCRIDSYMNHRTATKTHSPATLTVLSVSPREEDHVALQAIVGHSRWALLKASNVFSARALLLQNREISVVLCERDLTVASWIDILKHIQSLPQPPSLVVASKFADEGLWSEVLNLGGWDVLSKPFTRAEVVHSLKSAWQHWYNQMQVPVMTLKMMTAAR